MKVKLILGALLILSFVLAGCAPQAAEVTEAPQAAQPTTDPYAAGSDDMSAAAAVEIGDQAIEAGTITVAKVIAAVDGWIVIHTEADGKPGPVIGYAAVLAGESTDIEVSVDESQATPKLFAMLHIDEGTKGTYEFPGADAPAKNGEEVVMQAFNLASGSPSVTAADQAILDGSVVIDSAFMTAPGWVVIHTEADGKPGPVIGYAALPAGESTAVKVTVDAAQATPGLFAMLHIDAGTLGTYEFPGDDAPVKEGDAIVMVRFNLK